MFNQSYQQVAFHQQIISLNQTYPCPRCACGILEQYGHTETLQCNGCERTFVPLRGSRLLHPAKRLGFRVAPTFWWDGLRWHLAGTTATANQFVSICLGLIVPLMAINLAICLNLWQSRPGWCTPALMTVLASFVAVQMIYFCCWDFDFLSKRRVR